MFELQSRKYNGAGRSFPQVRLVKYCSSLSRNIIESLRLLKVMLRQTSAFIAAGIVDCALEQLLSKVFHSSVTYKIDHG